MSYRMQRLSMWRNEFLKGWKSCRQSLQYKLRYNTWHLPESFQGMTLAWASLCEFEPGHCKKKWKAKNFFWHPYKSQTFFNCIFKRQELQSKMEAVYSWVSILHTFTRQYITFFRTSWKTKIKPKTPGLVNTLLKLVILPFKNNSLMVFSNVREITSKHLFI